MQEVIEKIEFFSGLDRRLLKKVADSAILCQFGKDEVIVQEGENGLGLYIIVRGRVAVTRDREGRAIPLAELGPDQFFAEMSVLDGKPRSASVTTTEETECLLLTRDSFQHLMRRYPELSIRVARILADRLRAISRQAYVAPVAPPPPAPVPAAMGKTVPPQAGKGSKAMVQQKLLEVFELFYTAKALTRFSIAVLGCPVEGSAANVAEEIRVGEVKALIFPADEPVTLTIQAWGAGWFNLHLFTPASPRPYRFEPIPIQAGDRFLLDLPARSLRRLGAGRGSTEGGATEEGDLRS